MSFKEGGEKFSQECEEILTPKRSFVCAYDDCDKTYNILAHLKRHEDTHDGNFLCTEEKCGMKFKSKWNLKKHTDNIHLKKKPKKYKCTDCGEEFNKHNWLTKHRYKHTGIKPYECSVEGCNARFLFPNVLKKHMKVHEGYICSTDNCGEHFSKWTLYRSHLKTAHPKVYRCEFCEKPFSRSNNLKNHLEIHKLDREAFLCPRPNCSNFYFAKRNLTHHIKSYHDKRPFICTEEHCHEAFKSEEDLNAHLSRHDPLKRIRKKKKSKPKVSFAAKLAGFAPKKWQVESDSERSSNACSVESSDKCISKSQDEKPSTLSTAECCEKVTHLTIVEEANCDIQDLSKIESYSDCNSDNEIKELLSMIEKRTKFDTGSAAQKTKCFSIKA